MSPSLSAVVERSRRLTAGKRMSSLVGEALDNDETFWNHETWAEDGEDAESFRESDEDSDVRKDEFDSDFNDSETDNEAEDQQAHQQRTFSVPGYEDDENMWEFMCKLGDKKSKREATVESATDISDSTDYCCGKGGEAHSETNVELGVFKYCYVEEAGRTCCKSTDQESGRDNAV